MDSNEYTLVKTFACLPRTTRGLPAAISASPKGESILYTNGNSVHIVNVKDQTNVDIYTEHATAATVARMSPSGYYCASADQAGNVRIWDTTQKTHILKATYPVISGAIRDIAWSDDSKRLAVVGEGRERFGYVFLFDTGTSNGNLTGQSRPMSSVDFRPTRPYRIVSGSEDNTVALFEGPPFKFKTTFHEHQRFVHVTRYNPDGSLFASAGADGKIILFEGVEGAKQGQLCDPNCKEVAHSGGVFGLAWSPDGQKIASASGDKTLKIWSVPTRELLKTITFGTSVDDQQLAVVWSASALVSVSLSGFLNFIDPELGVVEKEVHGHNKPITSMVLSADCSFLCTADFEGNITRWEVPTGNSRRLTPMLHKSQVTGMHLSTSGALTAVAWDDTITFSGDISNNTDSVRPISVKLSSQPLGLSSSADGSISFVACYKSIAVFQKGSLTGNHPINYPSTCVSYNQSKNVIAVGGQDSKVHIYSVAGGSLTEVKTLLHAGHITAVAFSPNGVYLVATDSARKVIPYNVEQEYSLASAKEWTFHTARVNCVAWAPNSRHLATGALDTNIIVWDMEQSGEHPIIIKGAHAMSPVNQLAWTDAANIVSAGQDSTVKHWRIKGLSSA